MRGKKRMSKRVSTRQREKVNKKVKEHHRKQKKQAKNKMKIPASVYRTAEFKNHLEELKKATEERTKIFYEENKEAKIN